jgi:hypothetical protein
MLLSIQDLRVAQRIGHQREGSHEDSHEKRRGRELPPIAENQFALRFGQHRAPRDVVDAHPQAQV